MMVNDRKGSTMLGQVVGGEGVLASQGMGAVSSLCQD